jgi:hypothetical protein
MDFMWLYYLDFMWFKYMGRAWAACSNEDMTCFRAGLSHCFYSLD